MTALCHHETNFSAMGTSCSLEFYATSPEYAAATSRAVIAEIERIEQKYSRYRPNSFLSTINRIASHGGQIEVDDETAQLLDYAAECYALSDGLFDITSGLLRQAWDFKSNTLPKQHQLDKLLHRIGFNKLIWKKPILQFTQAGMELDLGGIGKEYAADLTANMLRDMGITHGLVELGGDIVAVGPRADGSAWDIDIVDPHNPTQDIVHKALSCGAVTTSGDMFRSMIVDGKRYGHILNPLTGWPVECLSSVSVFADHCMIAGSFSTIALLKGKDGPAWLSSFGVPYVSVSSDGTVIDLLSEKN